MRLRRLLPLAFVVSAASTAGIVTASPPVATKPPVDRIFMAGPAIKTASEIYSGSVMDLYAMDVQ